MSKLSDFYTRIPPPTGAAPGSWQYVADNPAPVWVDDEPVLPARRFEWSEFRAWIAPLTGVVALISKLLGLW